MWDYSSTSIAREMPFFQPMVTTNCCSLAALNEGFKLHCGFFREMVDKHIPLRYIVYKRLVQVLWQEHYFDEAIRIYELVSLKEGTHNTASMTFRNQNARTRSFLINTFIQQLFGVLDPVYQSPCIRLCAQLLNLPGYRSTLRVNVRFCKVPRAEFLPQFPNAFTIIYLLIGLLPYVNVPSRAPLTYTHMKPLPNYELPDNISVKDLAAILSPQSQIQMETDHQSENLNDESVEERVLSSGILAALGWCGSGISSIFNFGHSLPLLRQKRMTTLDRRQQAIDTTYWTSKPYMLSSTLARAYGSRKIWFCTFHGTAPANTDTHSLPCRSGCREIGGMGKFQAGSSTSGAPRRT
ncbi:hypothetical protein BJ742DRAFT_517560 [Cladochytrium replicatum]|nr:hypothetical protein BJ742DRAFT_517560 [Cladochytrium replicatum]